jgi:hypothetical protein
MNDKRPVAPADLGPRGLAFWVEVHSTYVLSAAEVELLAEACRVLDLLDRLRVMVEGSGVVVVGAAGQEKLNPALAEARASRALLAKLLGQLGLENPETHEMLPTWKTVRARHAASARWGRARTEGRVRGGRVAPAEGA